MKRPKRRMVRKPVPIPEEDQVIFEEEVEEPKPEPKAKLRAGRVRMPNGRCVIVVDSEFNYIWWAGENTWANTEDGDLNEYLSSVISGDPEFLEILSSKKVSHEVRGDGYSVRARVPFR